mgnify:CR=1 FL=1
MGNKLEKSRKGCLPSQALRPLRKQANILGLSNQARIIYEIHHHGNSCSRLVQDRIDSDEEVRCCVFAPDDENFLITASIPNGNDSIVRHGNGLGHLRVFDVGVSDRDTGKIACKKQILTYYSEDCDISSDGNWISFVLNDGRGEIGLLKRSKTNRSDVSDRLVKLQPQCNGITGQTLVCQFSPDGSSLLSAASLDFHTIRETNELRVWNVKSNQMTKKISLRSLAVFCGYITGCRFSPDGHYIVVTTSQEQICVLKTKNLEVACMIRKRCRDNMCWAVFNPRWTHEELVCCLQDGRVTVGHLEHLDYKDPQSPLKYTCQNEAKVVSSSTIHSCQFTHDGSSIAIGTSDSNILLLNSANLQVISSLDCKSISDSFQQNVKVNGISFSRSLQYLAAAYSDSRVRVWQLPVRFDLRHMCRVVVLYHVPANKIVHLPVPAAVKDYLLYMPQG